MAKCSANLISTGFSLWIVQPYNGTVRPHLYTQSLKKFWYEWTEILNRGNIIKRTNTWKQSRSFKDSSHFSHFVGETIIINVMLVINNEDSIIDTNYVWCNKFWFQEYFESLPNAIKSLLHQVFCLFCLFYGQIGKHAIMQTCKGKYQFKISNTISWFLIWNDRKFQQEFFLIQLSTKPNLVVKI